MASMLKKLLGNQAILYFFLLLGAVNVVLYLCTKRYECLGTLLLTAYLSNFVTGNRTVDIIIALIVANVLLGCGVLKEGQAPCDTTCQQQEKRDRAQSFLMYARGEGADVE